MGSNDGVERIAVQNGRAGQYQGGFRFAQLPNDFANTPLLQSAGSKQGRPFQPKTISAALRSTAKSAGEQTTGSGAPRACANRWTATERVPTFGPVRKTMPRGSAPRALAIFSAAKAMASSQETPVNCA